MIRQKRIERGLTQEQLAKMAGVTKNYVTMVERGTRKGISFMVRVLLADALGIPPTQVLTSEETEVLGIVEKGLNLETAELAVWSLNRYLREGGSLPPISKNGAAMALRKVMQARPQRRKEMESLRGELNKLYRQRLK